MSRNSSSDEESVTDHQTHIHLPNIDLAAVRKQNQRRQQTPKSNLARATSNFANLTKIKTKPSKFADSYTPRNPKDAINSSGNVSESEDDTDSVLGDPNLPDFRFRTDRDNPQFEPDTDRDSRLQEGMEDRRIDRFNIPPQSFLADSSDDEPTTPLVPSEGRPRSGSKAFSLRSKSSLDKSSSSPHKSFKNIVKTRSHADSHASHSESEGPSSTPKEESSSGFRNIFRKMSISQGGDFDERESGERKEGTFKGILRKMSLARNEDDHRIDELDLSNSDTFIGRVLNFGSDDGPLGGLSGGGMVPGASRASREENDQADDEERRVGFAPEAIEMRPLKYDDLSLEARGLIDQHLHDNEKLHLHNTNKSIAPIKEEDEIEEHKGEDPTEERTEEDQPKRKKSIHQEDEGYFTPNPDLYIRGDDQQVFEPHDDFLQDYDGEHFDRPKKVHAGVLSSLLRLYQPQGNKSQASLATSVRTGEESSSAASEPNTPSSSTVDFSKISSSNHGGRSKDWDVEKSPFDTSSDENSADNEGRDSNLPSFQNARPRAPKKGNEPVNKLKRLKNNKHREERMRITVHIADILQRQRFIMNMCRALMLFGAPTHRLEEYMVMTSRVLEIDGQFMYFPGCMLVSFGDAATRTSEVHLVRCNQGLNLSKLADAHRIYKAVIHDLIGVEDASVKLDSLVKSKNLYRPWMCVLFYGLGSVAVTPFAFEGGWIDLPISFGVGLCVGFLQFYVSPISHLYSSVFEVSASIIVAFISRGIGSINDGNTFCFSAICQGSLALILPGYIILCGSLELQSRNLVAGSVRMFYAIIYSLFLGFGITLGAALYGWVDKNAVSDNSCRAGHAMDDKFRILFVPMFALCLGLINQSHWKQLPAMILIAGIGYIGTYFAGKHFSQVTEFTSCIGAFIIGILGNLYSRLGKGMAVSAMLPAIFVQVPSGIASKSSLISGIINADQITKHNGTVTDVSSSSSLSFGATMVEVSIGISVGLFAAALVVYPFGKRRTGLFSFLMARHSVSSGWTIVQFEHGIKGIVATIDCGRVDVGSPTDSHIEIIPGTVTGTGQDLIENEQDRAKEDVLFVVLFYDGSVSDAIAKVKIDSLVGVLNDGLKGYLRS
ncbi:Pheromone-regulated membrane protein 10 [Spathaspora sp. JA1]|nr:Pheromone-regulated membrane protein 10 [Spathaspora sp. JA1]